MRTFKNFCYCGGWASVEKGNPVEQPHWHGCAQRKEWEEWYKEMIIDNLPKQPNKDAHDD